MNIFMIFLAVIGFTIFGFIAYSKMFNNPYKLIYILGKKGAGKTTLLVKYMIRDMKHGWHIYTDIPDICINGVHIIKTSDLATFVPPPNSALYLDEVGMTMDNREYKNFPSGFRDLLILQRHYKLKMYCVSQSVDADKKLRDRIDSLILQSNIGNVIGVSRPIYRTITIVEATGESESRVAENLKFSSLFSIRFTWLPRYHKYFKSFNTPYRNPIPSKVVTNTFDIKTNKKKVYKKHYYVICRLFLFVKNFIHKKMRP